MAKKSKRTTKKSSKKPSRQEVGRGQKAEKESKTESGSVKNTKIRVIGIGGGGGSIVSEIALKVKPVLGQAGRLSFLAANTDRQALKEVSRKVSRFQFGEQLTQGLGTGMNPQLAETAAQNEKDKIKKLLEGRDLVILIACLGGGVSSGASPIFAKISKSFGNLTLGIFTLPFKFEGEKKMEIAKISLEKLRPKLNALLVVPNERIFQIIDKATPLKEALSAINKNLTESLEGLIETIYEPGLINIDFADLKTILEGKGRLAYLNTVKVPKKEGASKEVIERLLNSPLYPYGIRGAKRVIFNIAGEKDLSLEEVNQISKTISDLLNKEAKIIFGVSQGKKYQDVIKTTLLATGCGLKIFSGRQPTHRPPTSSRLLTKKRRKKRKKITPVEKENISKKEEKKATGNFKKASRKKKRKRLTAKKIPRQLVGGEPKAEESNPSVSAAPPPVTQEKIEVKVRKNALQIKKEAEEAEREMLEKEKIWESPAFLRRKKIF